jgi:hypothetical protein
MKRLLPLVAILALAIFYGILQLPLPGLWKFALCAAEMFAVGQLLIAKFGLDGEWGLILLRSKKGLAVIDGLARSAGFWKFFSDTGATLSYGLLSIPLMRGNVSAKSVACGMLLLLLLAVFVSPEILPFLTQVLKLSVMEKAKEQMGTSPSSMLFPVASIALLLGGFFLLLLAGLLFYGLVVLSALASTIFSGTNAISSTTPGATMLLPGVNLPFFEGIAALVIIMAVHEYAHAILSRLARIPLLSTGVVLFGVIPIGAFVEPDENRLAKVEKVAQTRVLVAGSTANLMASLFFFVVFMLYAIILKNLGVVLSLSSPSLALSVFLVLGMAFALNFIIGTVNLLPLPFFDGYRIIDVNMKNKNFVKGLMLLTLAAFLMNLMPWLFAK